MGSGPHGCGVDGHPLVLLHPFLNIPAPTVLHRVVSGTKAWEQQPSTAEGNITWTQPNALGGTPGGCSWSPRALALAPGGLRWAKGDNGRIGFKEEQLRLWAKSQRWLVCVFSVIFGGHEP